MSEGYAERAADVFDAIHNANPNCSVCGAVSTVLIFGQSLGNATPYCKAHDPKEDT